LAVKARRDHGTAMETASLIGVIFSAQTGMLKIVGAARLAQMNNADRGGSIAQSVGGGIRAPIRSLMVRRA
jgi:hypothetical protein